MNPKILLIDDDQTVHLWAKRKLQDSGFDLVSSYDGESGIETFVKQQTSLVLIDVEMPGINGFAVCAKIRAMPNCENLPIVMMTVTEDPVVIYQAYASGATDFVVKPINWEVLCQRLQYMLKASLNLKKLEQSEIRLSKAKQMAKLGNWEWRVGEENLYWSDEIYALVEEKKENFVPNVHNFLNFIRLADLNRVKRNLRKTFRAKTSSEVEFGVVTALGNERFVAQHVQAITSPNGELVAMFGTVQDITERKAQENQILRLAFYDEVTQLPNRLYFFQRLNSMIALARRHLWSLGVLFLDLDGFKGINDTYGHQTGDQLLKEVSKRLLDCLRTSDLPARYDVELTEQIVGVARLGGDEFVVLLNALRHPENSATVAERILRSISEPFQLGNHLVHIGVSMGIAVYPQDGEDSEALLKNADLAMYHAKKMGRGQYQFFHEGMALKAKKRLEMESYMLMAAERNELVLYYQPVIDAKTNKLIGAEALLRWNHPTLGFMEPKDFINLAEENGMINRLGEWSLREACQQYQVWRQQGLGDLSVSVNLSSLQFNQSAFIPMVAGIIEQYQMDPSCLIFELTESTIMADTDKILEKLKEFKSLGVKLSIDDFGTGYSSLRYLNRFPLDALKIDRSFVNELPANKDAAAIVNAVLALGEALNLKTIAEGVETEAQLKFLRDNHCDALQGYYFSSPLTAQAFQEFCQQDR